MKSVLQDLFSDEPSLRLPLYDGAGRIQIDSTLCQLLVKVGDLSVHGRCHRVSSQNVGMLPRDVVVILGVDDRQPRWPSILLVQPNIFRNAISGRPFILDPRAEIFKNEWKESGNRSNQRDRARDTIRRHESCDIDERRNEDMSSKCDWVILLDVVLCNGHVDSRSQRLTEYDDSFWWDFGSVESPFDNSQCIDEKATFCGCARRPPKSAVVECQDMDLVWSSGRESSIVRDTIP